MLNVWLVDDMLDEMGYSHCYGIRRCQAGSLIYNMLLVYYQCDCKGLVNSFSESHFCIKINNAIGLWETLQL